jgi:hypothetical protein
MNRAAEALYNLSYSAAVDTTGWSNI